MRDRNYGRIVNISSINGQKGQVGQVNYSAAKAGLIGFTKALAQENAKKGITVNVICPGYIDTEMVAAVPAKVLEGIIATIPVGRLGKGEEKSGGRTKARLHASAREATIAAVLLDADVDTALRGATRWLEPHLGARAPGEGDFKSRVQEHLQAEGRGTPRYELVAQEGPEHARTFFVAIQIEGLVLARGEGKSKLEAEQSAARAAYESLTASTRS
jgi:dsRNA-specific ribonuclease